MMDSIQSNSHQSGVTVVELLIVVILIAIIAGFALMQRGSANAQLARQNVARDLKTAFERARFDSVKRRADGANVDFATVQVQAAQFTLTTDANQDGDIDDPSDSVVTPVPPNIEIAAGPGLALPLTISFNRRGEPDVADPVFIVCNGDCNYNNDVAGANIIHVTSTGTVNFLPGGSNITPFPTPPVQTIPGGTGIRSEIYVSPTP